MRQKAILFFNPRSEGYDASKIKEGTAEARNSGVDILMRDINFYTGESEAADFIMIAGDIPDGVEDKIRQQYKGKDVRTGSFDDLPSEPMERGDHETYDSDLPHGVYGDARGPGNTKDPDLRDQRLHQGGVQGALEGEEHGGKGVGEDGEIDTKGIVIPENYADMSWAEMRTLSSKIAGKNITSKTAARDIIAEEVKKREDEAGESNMETGSNGEDGQTHPGTDEEPSHDSGKSADATDGSGEQPDAPSDANPAEGTDDAPNK